MVACPEYLYIAILGANIRICREESVLSRHQIEPRAQSPEGGVVHWLYDHPFAPQPQAAERVASTGEIIQAGVASWKQMSRSSSRHFPVTVTQLPVARCQVCRRPVAYRPGTISQALTEHYRRVHPEALDPASR
jgi:hypothetical protein